MTKPAGIPSWRCQGRWLILYEKIMQGPEKILQGWPACVDGFCAICRRTRLVAERGAAGHAG